LIYRSYLCDSDESKKLKIDDSIELKIKEIELNEKFSYENLFKKGKV
jgi:Zn finger protein HypA/HybF involved in hydrogenase expression